MKIFSILMVIYMMMSCNQPSQLSEPIIGLYEVHYAEGGEILGYVVFNKKNELLNSEGPLGAYSFSKTHDSIIIKSDNRTLVYKILKQDKDSVFGKVIYDDFSKLYNTGISLSGGPGGQILLSELPFKKDENILLLKTQRTISYATCQVKGTIKNKEKEDSNYYKYYYLGVQVTYEDYFSKKMNFTDIIKDGNKKNILSEAIDFYNYIENRIKAEENGSFNSQTFRVHSIFMCQLKRDSKNLKKYIDNFKNIEINENDFRDEITNAREFYGALFLLYVNNIDSYTQSMEYLR